MMSTLSDLTRVLVALFYSGIFWMMMLFLLEERSAWRGSLAVATAMLILSGVPVSRSRGARRHLGVVASGAMTAVHLGG